MKIVAYILSIVFLALAVFGSFGAHDAIVHSVSCVGSLAQNASCPEDAGFNFVSFHLDGLRSFSNGISVAALFLVLMLGLALSLPVDLLAPVFGGAYKKEDFFPGNLLELRDWLSILEKRDPSAA